MTLSDDIDRKVNARSVSLAVIDCNLNSFGNGNLVHVKDK